MEPPCPDNQPAHDGYSDRYVEAHQNVNIRREDQEQQPGDNSEASDSKDASADETG